MHSTRHLALIFVGTVHVLLSSGCASIGNSIFGRPFQENNLDYQLTDAQTQLPSKRRTKVASVVGLVADRRAIVVNTRSPRNKNLTDPILFCAEPPPDVAMSVASSAGLAFEVADKGKIDFNDALTMLANGLATRTPMVETYRTAVFSLCQMHMNGAIDDEQAAKLFAQITLAVIDKIPGNQNANPPHLETQLAPSKSNDKRASSSEIKQVATSKPSTDAAKPGTGSAKAPKLDDTSRSALHSENETPKEETPSGH